MTDKFRCLKNRDKLRIAVEVVMFISLVFRSYYLFPIALLLWLIYLGTGMPQFWIKSKIVFMFYVLLSSGIIYLLFKSVSGLIKFWSIQGRWFI